LIQELLAAKADLIYTITTPVTSLAKKLTAGTETPVVFGPVMSSVDAGLVADLHSPDNTLTGVQVRGSAEKSLYYLKEIKPDLKNIYVPFHVGNGPALVCMRDLEKAAQKLGVRILSEDVRNEEELMASLDKIPAEAEAIWLSNSHLVVSFVAEIVEAGNRLKIPVASPVNQLSDGILVSYAPNHLLIGKQTSRLADKLLRGVKPANLPIETAEFFLGINLKAAHTLGLEVPQHMLNQANFIVR
jgi:putative ABC transport system substrate-binding protein